MTYKTLQTLGFWLPLTLCLAAANCGDPATGTWTNMTAPSASAAQYSSYKSTLTFGEAKSVMVDLETARSGGALTYAGCMESLTGTGTYTEVGTALTCTFDTGMNSRTGCVYPADNLASMALDDTSKATLLSLSSGNFVIVNGVMTLTVSSGAMLKYTKAM